MALKKFSVWLVESNKDIFGFAKEPDREQQIKMSNGSASHDPWHIEEIIDELVRFPLGAKEPQLKFNDAILWGNSDSTGSIRVDVSPFGSSKLVIRKLTTNLEGQKTWICKRIVPFNEGIPNKELEMAHLVLKELTQIDSEGLDGPTDDYKGLEKMALSIASRSKRKGPIILVYEGIRKVDDNNYIVHFGLRGQGVEAPGAKRFEQFHINLSFNPKTGLIHSWGNGIISPTNQHLWYSNLPEWDEYFCPSQGKEIEQAILNALWVKFA